MAQLGFYLDSYTCTGCKACQAACKDKHGLPVGLLYRRVYEVTGGGWTRAGDAWTSDVFAYNLSLACNHCAQPICAEVCPAGAYEKRADGIVLLESNKCIGCQYCTWVCPYGAPQYDIKAGITGKCTFCADEIDAGRSPACVAACPLRALEFGDVEELKARHGVAEVVYPLPDKSLTEPSLVIAPHRAASRARTETARIGNREEVGTNAKDETPLVIFTLLAQMAVGAFWTYSILFALSLNQTLSGGSTFSTTAYSLIAAVMGAAILASFAHLGRPLRAWRAFTNLRHSALSREILLATVFAGGAVLFAAIQYFAPTFLITSWLIGAITGLAGLGLVYNMARAYCLRTIPAWNNWTTPASFLATTLLLGGLAVGLLLVLPYQDSQSGNNWILCGIAVWVLLLLAAQLVMLNGWLRGLTGSQAALESARRIKIELARMLRWRVGLALAAMLVAVGMFLLPDSLLLLLCSALALSSELLGRILFYAARVRHGV